MSASFPIYAPLICPPGYAPVYDETLGPAVLQSGDATRSRLNAGGTFFRSQEAAHKFPVNEIQLICVVTFDRNISIDTDVYTVDFTIIDPVNGTENIPQFEQSYDNDVGSCVSNGPSTLRGLLNNHPVVTLPAVDSSGYDPGTSDACLLTSFDSLMSGGTGLPADDTGIRTGPTYALFHIGNADTAEDGSMEVVNELSEYDGTQWIPSPSTLYAPTIDENGDVIPNPSCPI